MSPELAAAIAEAAIVGPEGPALNRRGLFAIGPQFVSPSDVLAKLIAEQHCAIAAPTPENQRLQLVRYRGRERRKYAPHGRAEFLTALRRVA